MNYIISDVNLYRNNSFEKCHVLVENGVISAVSSDMIAVFGAKVINGDGLYMFPGFVDVHVHLREPGFVYKETIQSGTSAAARGGFTHVCSMPNLNPVPDSVENLKVQLDAIKKDAKIAVYPYGSITVGQKGEELSDLDGMAGDVIAFSDDGRGVQSDDMMKSAMIKAKQLSKMIVAHCEVNDLLNGGYIHDGEYAKKHGHRGICSESEWKQIERDIALAKETGVDYHVCHISTKESVALIRKAKKDGVSISCETAPHYLIFNDMDLQEHARFKMNPPIRSEEDRLALIEGIIDGTIDMIATDHAPHSEEEKSRGLEKSLMGVVGLETSFSAMYTHFVKTGVITMEQLMKLMHDNAKARFGIGSDIEVGKKADFTLFDVTEKYTVNPEEFATCGRFTPFDGMEMYGVCKMTVYDGKTVYES
ncbi:MAG: dihydroorotase [Clostridia bacterium]|nr:dihydroorotase [Clostridia bacterium]